LLSTDISIGFYVLVYRVNFLSVFLDKVLKPILDGPSFLFNKSC
jgi:hypothetical protein